MTDDEVRAFLEDSGYPRQAVEGGREYLLSRYRDFVGEVECGYEYGIHEYRHDLDIRAAIAVVDLSDAVAAEDHRLAAMLTATDIRVWESMPGEPFWDFGYPKNARPRLLRELRAVGRDTGRDEQSLPRTMK